MTSADAVAPRPPTRAARGPARATRGFTLVEMLLAFAILAVVMAYLIQTRRRRSRKGAKARDLRDIRVMSDTVFRKALYEIWQWQDGQSSTADNWYGGVRESEGPAARPVAPVPARLPQAEAHGRGQRPDGQDRVPRLVATRRERARVPRARRRPARAPPARARPGPARARRGPARPTPTRRAASRSTSSGSRCSPARTSEEPELTLRTIVPVPEIELEQDR